MIDKKQQDEMISLMKDIINLFTTPERNEVAISCMLSLIIGNWKRFGGTKKDLMKTVTDGWETNKSIEQVRKMWEPK